MAPYDFWLFLKLELTTKGNRYNTTRNIQKAITEVLGTISKKEHFEIFQIASNSKKVYYI